MSNANDVRRAHDLLDELDARAELSQEQEKLLRSFLPERPKQKALEELYREVYDVWVGTDGNEWPDDIHGDLETWLDDLHAQLQGLAPAKSAHPEFLETEADYENAPERTVVAADGGMSPIMKDFAWPLNMSRVVRRRVLRWGVGQQEDLERLQRIMKEEEL